MNADGEQATLELGPESEDGIQKKMAREIRMERFTRIDRSILSEADKGILSVATRRDINRRQLAHRMGRLKKLKSMGLAEELRPGVWRLTERTEVVLRQLGQRSDIMKTMQHALKQAGIDRGAVDYKVFDAGQSNAKTVGKIVAIGLSNELQDHHYVVVDGVDGKLHYAEIGRLSKYDPPSKDMVVTLRGRDAGKQPQHSQLTTARMFIESHVPFQNLSDAEGATWLDRKLLSKKPLEFRNKGFGAEANRALRLRQQWLVREELMTEQNGKLTVRRKLLETLQRRELSRVGQKLQKQIGLNYQPKIVGQRLKGQVIKIVKLASGHFGVLQKGKEFSLVPWRMALQLRKNVDLDIGVGKGISR